MSHWSLVISMVSLKRIKTKRNDNKTRRMKEEDEEEEFKTGLSLESLSF